MSTPWIVIDGYNLLHASGVFGAGGRTSLESSRTALLDWLGTKLGDAQRERTTIVFDARLAPPGLPKTQSQHGLRIHFAPRGLEADDLIEQLISEHSAPRSLIVVSGDHRIHRAARRRKAAAIDSEDWVAQLQRASAPKSPNRHHPPEMGPDEVQAWLDEFDAE